MEALGFSGRLFTWPMTRRQKCPRTKIDHHRSHLRPRRKMMSMQITWQEDMENMIQRAIIVA
ncbi:MAG: hypothetical protein ACYSOY_05690 [Planctomycetota bacterium]